MHTWQHDPDGPERLVVIHDGDHSGDSIIVAEGAVEFLPIEKVHHVTVPGRGLAAFGRDQTLDDVEAGVEALGIDQRHPPRYHTAAYWDGFSQALSVVDDLITRLRNHPPGRPLPPTD